MKRIFIAGIRLSVCTLLLAASSLFAHKTQPVKIKAAAIEVQMIQSDEIKLPAEFQIALYENLTRQLQKEGFPKVYRAGDRNATNVSDLVVLRITVHGFKEGSERARMVTTVAGPRPSRFIARSRRWTEVPSRAGCEREGPVLWRESQSDLRLRQESRPCRT